MAMFGDWDSRPHLFSNPPRRLCTGRSIPSAIRPVAEDNGGLGCTGSGVGTHFRSRHRSGDGRVAGVVPPGELIGDGKGAQNGPWGFLLIRFVSPPFMRSSWEKAADARLGCRSGEPEVVSASAAPAGPVIMGRL
jgi:hypothetical protein